MNLYLIAILPPEDISADIRYLKEEIRERFGAEHALKLPAHITLISPFKVIEENEIQLLQNLEVFATTRKPFHIGLSGFGNFARQVLFVDVEDDGLVKDLQRDLNEDLSVFSGVPEEKDFYPHVTIATRDLPEALFPAVRKFLARKDYESRFEVLGITLFKHNGREWEIFMDFEFKKS